MNTNSCIHAFPKYAKFLNGCCVMLESVANTAATYHRHAGLWETTAILINGKLMFTSPIPNSPKEYVLEGMECSEEEWKNDNAGYV